MGLFQVFTVVVDRGALLARVNTICCHINKPLGLVNEACQERFVER